MSELKRLLSGSGTVFLDTYWLSLSAWLRGGGTAGSHWCHSPVNRPDRRTIGPHVVVRKLSVSQAAAAHDIIWDQVWNTFAQTVYVTKNRHTCWTIEINHQHLSLLNNAHVHCTTQLNSLWIAPPDRASPLAVLPSTLHPRSNYFWQDNNPRTSAHRNTNTCTHIQLHLHRWQLDSKTAKKEKQVLHSS